MAEENRELVVPSAPPQVNTIDSKPSSNPKENAKIHDFLENAMHDPNRTVCFFFQFIFLIVILNAIIVYLQQVMHKRTQLNEDDPVPVQPQVKKRSTPTKSHQTQKTLGNK